MDWTLVMDILPIFIHQHMLYGDTGWYNVKSDCKLTHSVVAILLFDKVYIAPLQPLYSKCIYAK